MQDAVEKRHAEQGEKGPGRSGLFELIGSLREDAVESALRFVEHGEQPVKTGAAHVSSGQQGECCKAAEADQQGDDEPAMSIQT